MKKITLPPDASARIWSWLSCTCRLCQDSAVGRRLHYLSKDAHHAGVLRKEAVGQEQSGPWTLTPDP